MTLSVAWAMIFFMTKPVDPGWGYDVAKLKPMVVILILTMVMARTVAFC